MKYIASVTVAAILAGCTASPIPSPVSAEEAKSVYHDGRNIYDIARKWTSSEPKAATDLTYTDSDKFDMQIHRSLRKHERVKVQFDEVISPSDMPVRFEPWFTTIEESKGTVRVCTIDSNFAGLSVLSNLIYSLVKGLDDFATYAPSKAFDAEILVNSFQPDTVVRVEFISRLADVNRREACTPYSSSD